MLEFIPQNSPLLEKARQLMRTRHMPIRAERLYLDWMTQFFRFHRDKAGKWGHPVELGSVGVNALLTQLAGFLIGGIF